MLRDNMVGGLVRRAAEESLSYVARRQELPGWVWPVFFIEFILFLPVMVFVGYSLTTLYPTLAMIEDPTQATYDPVSLGPDVSRSNDAQPDDSATPRTADESLQPGAPITSSLRVVNRLLYSIGGWRSSFRGIFCAAALSIATTFIAGIIATPAWVPYFFGTLVASLALSPLSAVWTHIVISQPSPLPFWNRLPNFRRTFEATCFPIFISWTALTLARDVPRLFAWSMGLDLWSAHHPNKVPDVDPSAAWKLILVALLSLVFNVVAVIPSRVILVRVQASLLPPEEDPIVPFDRSFGGAVEPAIVGGKGYVTMLDAWRSFDRASWIRLAKMYLKIFVVSFVAHTVMFLIMMPQLIAFYKSKPYSDGDSD